eukprot:g13612.t1
MKANKANGTGANSSYAMLKRMVSSLGLEGALEPIRGCHRGLTCRWAPRRPPGTLKNRLAEQEEVQVDSHCDHLDPSFWQIVTSQGGYRGIDLPVAGLNITACRSAMCRAENVRVDGGLLRLQSDRDPSDSSRYFSAAVTTKDVGVWPAHWMLPENGYSDQCLDEGEMDITEMVYNTYHWMSSWPQQRCAKFDTYHKSAASSRRIRSYSSDFHEYAVERSMDHISYAVDGKVVGRFSSEEHGFQISSSPFFLILNTAKLANGWGEL